MDGEDTTTYLYIYILIRYLLIREGISGCIRLLSHQDKTFYFLISCPVRIANNSQLFK